MTKKIVSVIILMVTAAAFAGDSYDWFEAGFTGFYENDILSLGGKWYKTDEMVGEMAGNRLYVDCDRDYDSVAFTPFVNWVTYGYDVTIETEIDFGDGFEELPPVPSVWMDNKAAIAPIEDGNFYVLGYDEDGGTNMWIDSGIPFLAEDNINVSVVFTNTNMQHSVIYRFGAASTGPVRIYSSTVGEVRCSGSGSVSSLRGSVADAPQMVEIKLPKIEDIDVYQPERRMYAYPGERIRVRFGADYLVPSRGDGYYIVQDDGSLVFADEGVPPYAVSGEVTVNGEFVKFLATALARAVSGDKIGLACDMILNYELVFTKGTLDMQGHVIKGAGRIVFASGSNPRLDLNTDAKGRFDIDIVAETDLDFGNNAGIVGKSLILGGNQVKVSASSKIKNVVSGIDGYDVKETASNGGGYVYTLSRKGGSVNINGASSQQAFLLGCDVSGLEKALQEFRIVSIKNVNGKWDVRVSGNLKHGDRYGNGYICIKRVNLGSDANGYFFKAELLPDPPAE